MKKRIKLSEVSGEVNSSWGVHHELKAVYDKVRTLVPTQGKCSKEDVKLEKLRKAQNLAYDCFNNALCNMRTEFCVFYNVAGTSIPKYGYFESKDWDRLEIVIEKKLSGIIIEAFLEQYSLVELLRTLKSEEAEEKFLLNK